VDLNQLYFDHQVTLMRAHGAPSDDLQRGHWQDASLIAGRIGCMQRANGATAAPSWEDRAAAPAGAWSSAPFALHQDHGW
jgi:hypothetical protein